MIDVDARLHRPLPEVSLGRGGGHVESNLNAVGSEQGRGSPTLRRRESEENRISV
jgi:hypothetical protein